MRVLTILAALVLAMAGGAYAALIASGGGAAVGEPFVVLPVKPPPPRGTASPPAPAPASPAPAVRSSSPSEIVPAVAAERAGFNTPALNSTAAVPSGTNPLVAVPGLSIDAAGAAPPRAAVPRASSSPPVGFGPRPPGG